MTASDMAAGLRRASESGSYVGSALLAPGALPGTDELDRLIRDPGTPKNLIREGQRRQGVDPHEIRPGLASGWSLQVENAELHSPSAARLAGQLEDAVGGAPVRVNLYCSATPGRLGFPAHHDTLDAAVVQVTGVKRWEVWERSIEHPIWWMRDHNQPVDGTSPSLTADLAPGDVLFLRIGDPHRAVCVTPPSLHLTIGVRRANGHDFLSWLVDQATDRADIRAPMPWADTREEAETDIHPSGSQVAWVQELLDGLVKLGAGRSAEQWLEDYLDERTALSPIQAASPLAIPEPLDGESVVRVAHPQLRCRLRGAALVFGGYRVSVPIDLVSAVGLLVGDRTRSWELRQLSQHSGADLHRLALLARVLLEEGFLRLVGPSAP